MKAAPTPDACHEGRFADDGGWVTIWVLGLTILTLALGGLAVDLFRALDTRRDLAAIADAAAIAAASSIDTGHQRATGEIRLQPWRARAQAAAVVTAQDGGASLLGAATFVASDAGVTVGLTAPVDLTLLKLLMPGGAPLTVSVSADATPGLVPVP